MYSANAHVIRPATVGDEPALRRLVELDGRRLPFCGPALIGEIDGAPAAAISLRDGRIISDPFQPTAALRQTLELRLRALRSYARTPSLPERLLAATARFRARVATA
jgi:hypothetical protein